MNETVQKLLVAQPLGYNVLSTQLDTREAFLNLTYNLNFIMRYS